VLQISIQRKGTNGLGTQTTLALRAMLGRGSVEEEVEIRVKAFRAFMPTSLTCIIATAWPGLAVFTMYKAYVGSITASGGF